METTDLLASLGFEKNTSLIHIIESEEDLKKLKQEVNVLNLTTPVEAIDTYLEKWDAVLGRQPRERELADLGYRFWINNETPLLGRMTAEAQGIIEMQYAEEQLLYLPSSVTGQKQQVINIITKIVKHIIRGYILLPAMDALKKARPVILKYPSFFKRAEIADDEVMETAAWLFAIGEARLNPDISIRELEETRPLAPDMISVFESLQTPDRVKAIREHINIFLKTIDEGPYKSLRIDPNYIADGYNMAIRGENASVWALVIENRSWLTRQSALYDRRKYMQPGCIPGEVVRGMINNIQHGFAGSYYLAYLEKELKKKDLMNELNDNSIVKTERQAVPEQIRWGGQRNQVYALLQELKAMGLVNNTNQELAPILKAMFDVFRDTKVSTIEKELGRKQDLPKTRRIDAKKMITPKDTP